MKPFIVGCVLVAALAISCRAEETKSKTNWPGVLKKVGEIKEVITEAIGNIQSIAKKDNPEVAKVMDAKIVAAMIKAQVLFEESVGMIEKKSLSESEAQELFTRLEKAVLGIQKDVQDDLKKLDKKTTADIHATFISAYGQAKQKAKEIFSLLSKSK